jgi:hypothetical protein
MAAGGMPVHGPPSLRGVWAKVERAREHQDLLQREVDAYLALRPWRETEKRQGEQLVIRATVTREPSLRMAAILGDAVHNLRSALDHLVFAFQPGAISERESQFPILDTAPEGGLAAYRFTRHLPAPLLEMLDEVQPYHLEATFGGMIGRELRLVRDLSNRDKHRVLVVAGGVLLPGHVFHNTPAGQASGVEFRLDPDWRGAEIVLPADPTFGPCTHEFDAEVHIAEPGVDLGTPVMSTATEMLRVVEEIIGGSRVFWPLLGD